MFSERNQGEECHNTLTDVVTADIFINDGPKAVAMDADAATRKSFIVDNVDRRNYEIEDRGSRWRCSDFPQISSDLFALTYIVQYVPTVRVEQTRGTTTRFFLPRFRVDVFVFCFLFLIGWLEDPPHWFTMPILRLVRYRSTVPVS